MKTIKYLFMAVVAACSLTACMDDGYDEPGADVIAAGNNQITEKNVITVQELLNKYPGAVNGSILIEEDIQLKGVITGNDIEGNLYREVAFQDTTSAITLSINRSGLFARFAEGAEMLIDLKGLYIGNYGKQIQLAAYPSATEYTYASVNIWEKHYKLTGKTQQVEPEVFGDGSQRIPKLNWDKDKDGGKLGILKNVSFRNVGAKTTFSDPKGTSSVSLYFKEFSGSNLMVYTSMYADFAGTVVPQGKCNITGIFKRYNDKCEILIRKISDVEDLEKQ